MLDGILAYPLRHKRRCFGFAVIVSIIGGYFGRNIPTKLSLIDLLPETRESVKDFKSVAEEYGGIGYVGVVIGPVKTPGGPQKYLADAAIALRGIEGIRYAFFERETYSLRDKALYLIPRADFDGVLENTVTLVSKGKTGGFLDMGLDDDSSEQNRKIASATDFFHKLSDKYLTHVSGDADHQKYFISKDGLYAALWVKPTFDSEDLARSKKLLKDIKSALHAQLPKDVPSSLWGRYLNHVNDVEQVQGDIALTSAASMVGVGLLLFFGLGTLRGSVLTITCMLISMGWTLGFAKLLVGRINVVTGFLLAILGGLGVEYGIHLIRRYYQERKNGHSHTEALELSYKVIGRALLSAALTSSGAFLILSFSDFRGFSELGVIAGVGILSIYVVYMLAFPALASALPKAQRLPKAIERFGYYPFSNKWSWIIVPVLVLGCFGVNRSFFEYDMSKLQQLGDKTRHIDMIVRDIVERSTTPAALLAKTPEGAAQVAAYLDSLKGQEEGRWNRVIDVTVSQSSLVPSDMQERHRKLDRFKRHIASVSDTEIQKQTGIAPDLIRTWIQHAPYALKDLPINLWDGLGQYGQVTLVYTRSNLSHFANIQEFSSLLQHVKEKFPDVKIGSDVRIFSEILDHIVHDGRYIMLAFLAGAFFVLWLDFGSLKEAAALELQLIAGIGLLVGLMGLCGVPFTILNVAMVPAVLAAGIDMGVHLRHRELESGDSPLQSAHYVAQAVHLGALTSVVGFGSLFLAHGSMLRGIAWVSCLGQVSMYLVCMLLWPLTKNVAIRTRRLKVQKH